MISAKKALEGTKVEVAIKEELECLERVIQGRMDQGFAYAITSLKLTSLAKNQLLELGYTVGKASTNVFSPDATLISWTKPTVHLGDKV